MGDEPASHALDAIAAGLALPLAAGDVGGDFLIGQALHLHASQDRAAAHPAVRGFHGDAGKALMRPAGQQAQEGFGFCRVGGLFQITLAKRHNRVGRQHKARLWTGLGLLPRQSFGQLPRRFVLATGFVDVSGADRVRHNPDLGEQVSPPGTRTGEDQGNMP